MCLRHCSLAPLRGQRAQRKGGRCQACIACACRATKKGEKRREQIRKRCSSLSSLYCVVGFPFEMIHRVRRLSHRRRFMWSSSKCSLRAKNRNEQSVNTRAFSVRTVVLLFNCSLHSDCVVGGKERTVHRAKGKGERGEGG